MASYPQITNRSPDENVKSVDGCSLVSFETYDEDNDINPSSIFVYVNGSLAFSGPNTFIAPYNGVGSLIEEQTVLGYNGYRIVLDYTGCFTSNTEYTIRAIVSDYTSRTLDDSWVFRTGNSIKSVSQGEYEINIEVEFEEDVLANGELAEPANYIFSYGMYARYAEVISLKKVKLWVENFSGHLNFTLSVNKILDVYGNVIPTSYNNFIFSPFYSSADLTNYNAKVRTWHDSKLVSTDDDRVYLAGEKGIDVFNKEIAKETSLWAQIFNSGKPVKAMFVANTSTYKFRDSDPPYLVDVIPAPDSMVLPPGTPIMFSITDEKTSVNPLTILVRVNNRIVFDGSYDGWKQGYSGYVIIGYKVVEVLLKPPLPFIDGDDVTVRVVAKDIMKNKMDVEYTYHVTTAVARGWGLSSWGRSNFGFGTING
jgi:hypothetical protein